MTKIFKGQALTPMTGLDFEWVTGKIVAERRPMYTTLEDSFKNHRTVYTASLVELADTAQPPNTVRAKVLDEAKRITATDRNSAYGEPEDNLQRIADFWNVFLQDKLREGAKITPGDTAALVIMIKLAREMNAPKEDNKTDIAGYAACWAEVDAQKGK